MDDDTLCWLCGGEGCRLCGYTGREPVGETDWFEAAKEHIETDNDIKQ